MNKEAKKFNKCPICGRPTHKESEYCIFHTSAEEKTENEFKEALKEYIQEIKKEDKGYNFEGFIFVGDINFNNIEFNEDPKFINTKFIYGSINFKGTRFKEKTSFSGVVFNGSVDFSGAFFSKEVEFKGTNFEGGFTSFRKVVFCGDVFFEGNIFRNDIDFCNAGFKENFSFGSNKFNGSEINFNYADINKKFEIALNEKHYININFESITTYFAFVNITLMVINGNISFKNTLLEKISLCFEVYNDSYIDFEGARIKDTILRRDHIEGHIIQENRKTYDKAKEIYITLKNNFHSIGRYEDESWAYLKERNMERFAYFKNSRYLKWTISGFLNFLYGYGEEPLKVLRFAIIVILFFSFLYFNYGISLFVPEIRNVKYDFFQNVWLGIKNTKLLSSIIINFPWGDYLNSLYFSLTTFATLAFGNIGPITIVSKIIAGIESFIGPFTIALFVYTFARRTGGR